MEQPYNGVSLVIPLRDEVEVVPLLVARLQAVLAGLDGPVEVLFVDDGSTDGTSSLLSRCIEDQSLMQKFRVIHLSKSVGQARAIGLGINRSRYSTVIRMDGDLQDSPEDLPKFFRKIQSGYDLVVGVREVRAHSRLERFGSALFSALAILFLDSPFHSSVGSFVAFRKRFFEGLRFSKQTNRWMVLIALCRGAKAPAEVFVSHNPRVFGFSKYPKFAKVFQASLGAIWFFSTAKVRFRPVDMNDSAFSTSNGEQNLGARRVPPFSES